MGIDHRGTCPHFLKWRLCVVFQSVFEVKFLHVFKYWLTTVFAWFGFETCIKANSPLVNCLISDTAGCLFTFQSHATLKLISWFSVLNFIKKIKHAGDGIYSCTSLCQNLSDYGIILQRYCTQLFSPSILITLTQVYPTSRLLCISFPPGCLQIFLLSTLPRLNFPLLVSNSNFLKYTTLR